MDLDINYLQQWRGNVDVRTDLVAPAPIAAMSATLDRDDPSPQMGDALPPIWHWLYFLPLARQSEIGEDGHPRRGGFLPPVPLPRRMFAGGRLQFHRPLLVGDTVTRKSTILDVRHKEGRTGPLVFVQVRHEVSDGGGLLVTEEQDIVYRDHPRPDEPAPAPRTAPADAAWTRQIEPDEVLLFRYSALIFVGHRIHYDRPYATGVEGYPGLVVHGPLIATLLADLVRRNLPNAPLAGFTFRAIRPLYDKAPFSVCGRVEQDGKTVTLWAQDANGWLAMEATATLA